MFKIKKSVIILIGGMIFSLTPILSASKILSAVDPAIPVNPQVGANQSVVNAQAFQVTGVDGDASGSPTYTYGQLAVNNNASNSGTLYANFGDTSTASLAATNGYGQGIPLESNAPLTATFSGQPNGEAEMAVVPEPSAGICGTLQDGATIVPSNIYMAYYQNGSGSLGLPTYYNPQPVQTGAAGLSSPIQVYPNWYSSTPGLSSLAEVSTSDIGQITGGQYNEILSSTNSYFPIGLTFSGIAYPVFGTTSLSSACKVASILASDAGLTQFFLNAVNSNGQNCLYFVANAGTANVHAYMVAQGTEPWNAFIYNNFQPTVTASTAIYSQDNNSSILPTIINTNQYDAYWPSTLQTGTQFLSYAVNPILMTYSSTAAAVAVSNGSLNGTTITNNKNTYTIDSTNNIDTTGDYTVNGYTSATIPDANTAYLSDPGIESTDPFDSNYAVKSLNVNSNTPFLNANSTQTSLLYLKDKNGWNISTPFGLNSAAAGSIINNTSEFFWMNPWNSVLSAINIEWLPITSSTSNSYADNIESIAAGNTTQNSNGTSTLNIYYYNQGYLNSTRNITAPFNQDSVPLNSSGALTSILSNGTSGKPYPDSTLAFTKENMGGYILEFTPTFTDNNITPSEIYIAESQTGNANVLNSILNNTPSEQPTQYVSGEQYTLSLTEPAAPELQVDTNSTDNPKFTVTGNTYTSGNYTITFTANSNFNSNDVDVFPLVTLNSILAADSPCQGTTSLTSGTTYIAYLTTPIDPNYIYSVLTNESSITFTVGSSTFSASQANVIPQGSTEPVSLSSVLTTGQTQIYTANTTYTVYASEPLKPSITPDIPTVSVSNISTGISSVPTWSNLSTSSNPNTIGFTATTLFNASDVYVEPSGTAAQVLLSSLITAGGTTYTSGQQYTVDLTALLNVNDLMTNSNFQMPSIIYSQGQFNLTFTAADNFNASEITVTPMAALSNVLEAGQPTRYSAATSVTLRVTKPLKTYMYTELTANNTLSFTANSSFTANQAVITASGLPADTFLSSLLMPGQSNTYTSGTSVTVNITQALVSPVFSAAIPNFTVSDLSVDNITPITFSNVTATPYSITFTTNSASDAADLNVTPASSSTAVALNTIMPYGETTSFTSGNTYTCYLTKKVNNTITDTTAGDTQPSNITTAQQPFIVFTPATSFLLTNASGYTLGGNSILLSTISSDPSSQLSSNTNFLPTERDLLNLTQPLSLTSGISVSASNAASIQYSYVPETSSYLITNEANTPNLTFMGSPDSVNTENIPYSGYATTTAPNTNDMCVWGYNSTSSLYLWSIEAGNNNSTWIQLAVISSAAAEPTSTNEDWYTGDQIVASLPNWGTNGGLNGILFEVYDSANNVYFLMDIDDTGASTIYYLPSGYDSTFTSIDDLNITFNKDGTVNMMNISEPVFPLVDYYYSNGTWVNVATPYTSNDSAVSVTLLGPTGNKNIYMYKIAVTNPMPITNDQMFEGADCSEPWDALNGFHTNVITDAIEFTANSNFSDADIDVTPSSGTNQGKVVALATELAPGQPSLYLKGQTYVLQLTDPVQNSITVDISAKDDPLFANVNNFSETEVPLDGLKYNNSPSVTFTAESNFSASDLDITSSVTLSSLLAANQVETYVTGTTYTLVLTSLPNNPSLTANASATDNPTFSQVSFTNLGVVPRPYSFYWEGPSSFTNNANNGQGNVTVKQMAYEVNPQGEQVNEVNLAASTAFLPYVSEQAFNELTANYKVSVIPQNKSLSIVDTGVSASPFIVSITDNYGNSIPYTPENPGIYSLLSIWNVIPSSTGSGSVYVPASSDSLLANNNKTLASQSNDLASIALSGSNTLFPRYGTPIQNTPTNGEIFYAYAAGNTITSPQIGATLGGEQPTAVDSGCNYTINDYSSESLTPNSTNTVTSLSIQNSATHLSLPYIGASFYPNYELTQLSPASSSTTPGYGIYFLLPIGYNPQSINERFDFAALEPAIMTNLQETDFTGVSSITFTNSYLMQTNQANQGQPNTFSILDSNAVTEFSSNSTINDYDYIFDTYGDCLTSVIGKNGPSVPSINMPNNYSSSVDTQTKMGDLLDSNNMQIELVNNTSTPEVFTSSKTSNNSSEVPFGANQEGGIFMPPEKNYAYMIFTIAGTGGVVDDSDIDVTYGSSSAEPLNTLLVSGPTSYVVGYTYTVYLNITSSPSTPKLTISGASAGETVNLISSGCGNGEQSYSPSVLECYTALQPNAYLSDSDNSTSTPNSSYDLSSSVNGTGSAVIVGIDADDLFTNNNLAENDLEYVSGPINGRANQLYDSQSTVTNNNYNDMNELHITSPSASKTPSQITNWGICMYNNNDYTVNDYTNACESAITEGPFSSDSGAEFSLSAPFYTNSNNQLSTVLYGENISGLDGVSNNFGYLYISAQSTTKPTPETSLLTYLI